MRKRGVLPTALLAATIALSAPAALGGLLESMPSGYDFYLAFDPEAVGMDRFLEALAATPLGTDGDIQQLGAILGFDPMDWNAWSDALALEPDTEIGLIIDMGGSDPSLIGLYLPTSDQAAVEDFFRVLIASAPDFDGSLKFRQTEDHLIILVAEDLHAVTAFDPSGPSLDSDPDFGDMAGSDPGGTSLGSIYLDLSALNEGEDLSTVLFRAAVDDDRLRMSLSARTVDPDVSRFASVITGSPGNASFGVPDGTDGTLRVSLDMESILTLLIGEGITAEYDAGATEFGFMPASEFLDLFSGEMLLTLATAQDNYSAILQLDLEDPVSAGRLLALIRTVLDGAEGDVIRTFDLDGTPCYSVDVSIAPGIRTLEYGILDDALVIAGGCRLRDPRDDTDYEDWIDDRAPDTDTGSTVLFTASSVLLQDLLGNDSVLLRDFSRLTGGLDIATASLNVEGDILSFLVTLDPSSGDPGPMVTRILMTFFLGVLFG
jgi:hypothetical protein